MNGQIDYQILVNIERDKQTDIMQIATQTEMKTDKQKNIKEE